MSKQATTYWDAPPERLAAMRIWIGAFAAAWVAFQIPVLAALAKQPESQFRPLGIVRVLDAPLSQGIVVAITIATVVLMLAFAVGLAYRVVAPIAAIVLLWTLCYRTSWGNPMHTDNLLVLHVIVLAVAPAADVWALGPRRRGEPWQYGWAIRLMAALVAGTYLLAGIAKLRITGYEWCDGEVLRNHIAIDNARKLLFGDFTAPLATLFLDHPAVLTAFSTLTLGLELGAPIALLGGRWGRWWAAGAWGFHFGVVLLMNIWFLYPLLGLAFLPLLRSERPIAWLFGRWRTSRESSTQPAG